MTGFVKIILEASFTAGLAALAVMLIRLAMKKAPKRWAYALWAVVFFRCLCPFSVESGLSVFNAVNAIPERTAETETVEALPEAAENSEIENILPVQTDLNTYGYQTAAPVDTVYVPPAAVRTENVPEKKPVNKYAVMFGVWAFGASAMALYGVISYVLLMRKLRTAVKTEEGVYESDLISTAFSAGFFPPKIYVPCGLFEEEKKLIIAHERVHIKRLDYIVKPIAFIALTVHWFNPVIWLAFALMTKDMELSCDEAVLKIFGAGEKKAYSEALLRVSMKRSGLADSYNFLPLAFAETGIKGRVKNVLKYKKPTVIVTVLAAAAVIAACVVLGTNAKSESDDGVENAAEAVGSTVYVSIPEGETDYILADGAKVCIAHAPDKNTSLDSTDERVYGIQYTSDTNGGDKSRSVWLGMRAKNNELNRQICLDFGNKKITGFSVEDIYATDLQFTAVIKVTLADGEEITVISPNEPNAEIRVVNGDKENEYLLYMTADYNRENVDEYAIDLNGFDDITPQINAACADILLSEGEVVYDQIFKGTTDLSLNDYTPAYIVCGLEEEITGGAVVLDDSGNVLSTSDTFNTIKTYRVEFHNAYTDKMDAFYLDYFWNEETRQKDNVRILAMTTKFGANLIAESLFDMTKYDAKNITLEDMYTENKADALYLTVKLKFVSDSNTEEFLEEISKPVLDTPGTYTTVVEKGVNEGEYTVSFRIRYINNVYNLDSFAVVLCGFDEAEKYVNPKLLLDYPHTEDSENAASRENAKIQKVYKNGFVTIELYDSGYFRVINFTSSHMAVPSPEKEYRYENKELILTFDDGSELYFDMVYDEKVQDDKLVFNEKLSRRTDARSRDIPSFYSGEVFLPDNDSLEYSKAAEREKAYQSSINCSDLEMIYSRDFRSIYLYKNGDFDFYDSSRENDPNEGIDGSYKIDGETLTLKYNDGGKLCFDMISSAKEETDPDLVKEFEMCKYKLVYNKKNSRIPKKSTESIPEIYHGEIFDYDGIFIVMKMEAGEVSEEFIKKRTLTDEELRRIEEEQERVKEKLRKFEEEARKRAEEALKSSYPALRYPVSAVISDTYGESETGVFNKGINFAVQEGTPVCAAGSGTVIKAKDDGNGYGLCVIIDHGAGEMHTLYAHLSEITVREGGEVNAGDLIGYSGKTGNTYGASLHFEVRIDGQHVDPIEYLCPVLSYPTTGGIYRKYGEDGAKGIDFDAPTDTPVYASADGTVAETDPGRNGITVTVNHRGNMETVYAHMKSILVKVGDEVKKGDLIGYSGTTGDTAYQTLFFGVRINGSYVDPMDYLGLRHFDGDKFVE